MKRVLFWSEILFLITFWWQARISLAHWWPTWVVLDGSIDYLIPFIYLSDVLFGVVLVVWGVSVVRISSTVLGECWRWAGLEYGALRGKVFCNFRWAIRTLKWPGFWLGVLLLAGVLSLLINSVGTWGWYRWFKLIEGGLMAWWVSRRWGEERWKWYGGTLLAGLGFEAILIIGEWWRQGSLGWQWLGEWQFTVATPGVAKVLLGGQKYLRPMGTFAHANIVAAVMVVALPLGWWWGRRVRIDDSQLTVMRWTVSRQIGEKLVVVGQWGWVGLMVVAIGLSFSRSAWLILAGLAVVILCWWKVWQFKVNRRLRVGWVGAGAVGAVAVIWMLGPVVMGRFGSLAGSDSWSASLRWELLQAAWQMWLGHPWGVGLNTFTLELARNMNLYHLNWWQPVHNVLMLVLAEMGFLGILGLLGLLVATIGWLGRRFYEERWLAPRGVWVLAGVWAMVLGLSLVDHYWWTSQQAFLAVWGLGGGTWLYKVQDSKLEDVNLKTKSQSSSLK